MSLDLVCVLDVQRRRLEELEIVLDALEGGRRPTMPQAPTRSPADFAGITDEAERWRRARGVHDLLPAPRPEHDRRSWASEDIFVAGLAGGLGFAAAWYDDRVDAFVRDRLKLLSDTALFRRWEFEAKLPAIDWAGKGFGGPNHRVRRPGHDLLRPIAALRQLLSGQAEGVRWVDGLRVRDGLPRFDPVDSVGEALVLWLKHLATDVVTDRSLPLPGWTFLNELPWEEAQQFARFVYMGERDGAPGLTLRSGVLQTLPVLTTETLVRAHLHGRAFRERGTPRLTEAERSLRDEMLLAAHGLTGAACLGRTLTAAMVPGRGPLALRHLNTPVLLRLGTLGLTVARRHGDRAPDWSDLLRELEKPWTLDIAAEIDTAAGQVERS